MYDPPSSLPQHIVGYRGPIGLQVLACADQHLVDLFVGLNARGSIGELVKVGYRNDRMLIPIQSPADEREPRCVAGVLLECVSSGRG